MAMRPDEYRVMFEIEEDYWWYRGLRTMLAGVLRTLTPNPPLASVGDSRSPDTGEGSIRILDAGCGTGANLKRLQKYGCAIGVDVAETAIDFCRARGIPPDRAFVASLLDLPFATSHFDLAVSFDVICNITDDVAAFREIARVLKPGAPLVVQLPAYRALWSAHDEAVGHKHRYTAREVREKMTRAGFAVERATYVNALLFPFEALARLWRRGDADHPAGHSDLVPLPRIVNALLTILFVAEMRLVPRVNFPFGLSVLAVGRKGG
jgi:SAM-dependent methyltransferase